MWKTQIDRVTGRGHQRQGMPCQDRVLAMERNGVTVVALADGAGSAPLSHEGAECAVQTACTMLCERFDELFNAHRPAEVRQFLLSGVRDSIQRRAEALGAEKDDLACTLLAVAVRGDAYLLFHVGDGVIGYQKSGKLRVASVPQNGEFANTTTFVTSPDALLHSRALRGNQPQIEGFVLMSDGCEAALYHKGRNRLAPLLHKLFQRLQLLDGEASQMMMGAVMEHAIAERTQDDCSMALLVRKKDPFDAWLQMTQREKAQVLGIATGNRNRRRRAIRQYARLCDAENGQKDADCIF